MKLRALIKGGNVNARARTSGLFTATVPGIRSSLQSTRHCRATKLLIAMLATVPLGSLGAALDHFEWSVVPSPQQGGTPFAVTVTARDAQNGIVVDYAGPATLRGIQGEPASSPNTRTAGDLPWKREFPSRTCIRRC